MYKRLTGTLTFASGSTVITGTGTHFTTEVTPGQYIRLESDPPTSYMIVAAVNSDTSLTLAAVYAGSSATGSAACSAQPTGVYPSGSKIPVTTPFLYKTINDFQNDAAKAYPVTPAIGGSSWRGITQDSQVMNWEYAGATVLDASLGLEIEISLQHDTPYTGTFATATLYCLQDL